MNSYADKDYYNNEFPGEKIITDEKELERHLILASQKIDEITYNRIIGKGFDKLTKFQQSKVKMAVCYQANYIIENGVEANNIVGYSVLDLNISIGNNNSVASQLHVSDVAYNCLKQTGLTSGIL